MNMADGCCLKSSSGNDAKEQTPMCPLRENTSSENPQEDVIVCPIGVDSQKSQEEYILMCPIDRKTSAPPQISQEDKLVCPMRKDESQRQQPSQQEDILECPVSKTQPAPGRIPQEDDLVCSMRKENRQQQQQQPTTQEDVLEYTVKKTPPMPTRLSIAEQDEVLICQIPIKKEPGHGVKQDEMETISNKKFTVTTVDCKIVTLPMKEESPQKITIVRSQHDGITSGLTIDAEEDTELELIIVPPVVAGSGLVHPDSRGTEVATEAEESPGSARSPDLRRRLSRTDSAKQDMRKLKSATLGRMGKMLRIRSSTPSSGKAEKTSIETEDADEVVADDLYGESPTRKEKTNSLGRMLRLVDKDGVPRKLFSHPRAGSLTRVLRKHSSSSNATNAANKPEDTSRNIFSRMLNQLRGRNAGANTAEPNLQSSDDSTNGSNLANSGLPPKLPLSSRLMSHSSRPPPAPTSTERVKIQYSM